MDSIGVLTTSTTYSNSITLLNASINEAIVFCHTRAYTDKPLAEGVYSITEEARAVNLTFKFIHEIYCSAKFKTCDACNIVASCDDPLFITDTIKISIQKNYLSQSNFKIETLLRPTQTICHQIQPALIALSNYTIESNFVHLYISSSIHLLLIQIIESCNTSCEKIYTCKFLENINEREKISHARTYILNNIGSPISIKQLSRVVAINDCYLKKGFKELYGQTINEFYQSERMRYAKNLLYEKGLSVTDVSNLLGFSSISHFSSSFKKHTGLKPCELLIR